jgi:hypothetical protein
MLHAKPSAVSELSDWWQAALNEVCIKYQPQLYPRSLTVVNILGSQKCTLSLDVP